MPLEGELWRKNAQNANSMARYLAKNLRKLNIKITQKVETNTVFARIENDLKTYINERYLVDSYDHNNSVRLMISWFTTRAEIDEFVDYIKSFKNLK